MEFLQNFFDRSTLILFIVGSIGIVGFMVAMRLANREHTTYEHRHDSMSERIQQSEVQTKEYALHLSMQDHIHILAIALQDVLELKYPHAHITIHETPKGMYIHMPQAWLHICFAPHRHNTQELQDCAAHTPMSPWHVFEHKGIQQENPFESTQQQLQEEKIPTSVHFASLGLLEQYILSRFAENAEDTLHLQNE